MRSLAIGSLSIRDFRNLAKVDLDPYSRAFRNVSTHILATELDEPAIRRALREGHAYVSHDWMCDPTGFRFELVSATGKSVIMGDEVPLSPGARIVAQFPVPCKIRLMEGGRVVNERTGSVVIGGDVRMPEVSGLVGVGWYQSAQGEAPLPLFASVR